MYRQKSEILLVSIQFYSKNFGLVITSVTYFVAHQEYIISEKEIYKSIWYIDFIESIIFPQKYILFHECAYGKLVTSIYEPSWEIKCA